MENVKVNRAYKDVMFRMIFREKKELLDLYNAVNRTDYTNEEDITVVTLKDAFYVNVKNDLAFLFGAYLNLYEHQSTPNPNLPVRDLIYIAKEYSKLLETGKLYSSKLQKIPTPKFLAFYNGTDEQPEEAEYRLSEAFAIPEEDPQAGAEGNGPKYQLWKESGTDEPL